MKCAFGDSLSGETPLQDWSGLKISGIKTRQELSVAEAKNIRPVLVKYLLDTPTRSSGAFDLAWVKELHREMFGEVWDWAGEFRNSDLNLGCSWIKVQEKLYGLLKDLKVWDEYNHDIVEQSAWLHHRSVQIHPFLNGNGRWSRMLANIWLVERQAGIIEWPDAMGETSPVRGDYIKALKAADNGDYAPLVELHRRFLPLPPATE
jgi:Fic-DOC domain mobile mystery protein B